MREDYLIDPDGICWSLDQVENLFRMTGSVMPDFPQSLLNEFVSSRGYASWRRTDNACQLLFNPKMIRLCSHDAIVRRLKEHARGFILTGSFLEDWRYRLHATSADAMDYVKLLVDRTQTLSRKRLHSKRLSKTDLLQSETPSLSHALDLLREHNWHLFPETKTKLSELVHDRFLVCASSPVSPSWSVDQAGAGYGSEYFICRPGKFISDQPDPIYGRWLHEQYDRVMQAGRPCVDAITVSLGDGKTTYSYRRILVPLMNVDSRRLLLSASLRCNPLSAICRNEIEFEFGF